MSKDISTELEEHLQGSAVRQKMLVTIYAPNTPDGLPLRIVANSDNNLVFEGNTYYAAEVKRGDIKSTLEGDKEQIPLTLSNRNNSWAVYLANNGNKLNGVRCVIQEVYIDYLDQGAVWMFEGVLNSIRMTVAEFNCKVQRDTVDYSQESPTACHTPPCWYNYKDWRCQATTAQTTCSRTWDDCVARSNQLRYGGHLSIPKEMVVK